MDRNAILRSSPSGAATNFSSPPTSGKPLRSLIDCTIEDAVALLVEHAQMEGEPPSVHWLRQPAVIRVWFNHVAILLCRPLRRN